MIYSEVNLISYKKESVCIRADPSIKFFGREI